MSEWKRTPAVEGLFTWPSEDPRLIGGRCACCGTYFFPEFSRFHKPGCDGSPVEQVLLSKQGKLVSYTVQYYPPPPPFVSPEPYEPMIIGSVSLEEGIQILGQLIGVGTDDIKLGANVEIVIDKLYTDQEGNEFLVWKFRPM